MTRFYFLLIFFSVYTFFLNAQPKTATTLTNNIISGELEQRMLRNVDRLQAADYDYNKTLSKTKATTNMALSLHALTAQANNLASSPQTIKSLWSEYGDRTNELGYFGNIFPDSIIDETQLATNGAMLLALAAYFQNTSDSTAISRTNFILDNLVMPTQFQYPNYWKLKQDKSTQNGKVNWHFSEREGDLLLLFDGLVSAYSINKRAMLLPIINLMVDNFTNTDIAATHFSLLATLHGVHACVRFATITGNKLLLAKATTAYNTVFQKFTGVNFEVTTRTDNSVTDAAATAMASCCAFDLWHATQNARYLEQAQLIYYNALCFEQRSNGGFGIQQFSGADSSLMQVYNLESVNDANLYGGIALGELAHNSITADNQKIRFAAYFASEFSTSTKKQHTAFTVDTQYPFSNLVNIAIQQASVQPTTFVFPEFSFLKINSIEINGKKVQIVRAGAFVSVTAHLKKGDKISLDLNRAFWQRTLNNKTAYMHGPLLLANEQTELPDSLHFSSVSVSPEGIYKTDNNAITLKPVYHLLDPIVAEKPIYRLQILFKQ